MTEASTTTEVDKTADVTDTTKAAETTTQSTTAATTEAAKTTDVAKTGDDKKASGEAAKEFVADTTKTDAENDAARAEFDKANPADDKKGLPDDWRETAAGGDEAALKMLKRYGSLTAVAKALVEKEALIRSGKVKSAMPDPKDEKAMAEWRKTEGIPPDPTGYKLPEAVQKKMVDEDKPILSSFTDYAFKMNARPDVVDIATAWYVDMAEAAQAKQIETDKADKDQAEDELRKDWAHGEYKANTTMASRWIETVPGLGKDWLAIRGPDGRMLGSNPEFIAWAAENGREKFGDVAFTTSDSERKHTARKEEIEKIIGTDEYFEKGLDKEYAAILEKDLKRRK